MNERRRNRGWKGEIQTEFSLELPPAPEPKAEEAKAETPKTEGAEATLDLRKLYGQELPPPPPEVLMHGPRQRWSLQGTAAEARRSNTTKKKPPEAETH